MGKINKQNNTLRLGIFAIGLLFIFFGGFYSNAIYTEMQVCCSYCEGSCLDYDPICGDFGVYYFKFLSLIFLVVVGALISFVVKLKIEGE